MANGYQQSFLDNMADLLISNKYTDMMILSKTDGFNMHRAIVCPQSEGLASQIDTLLPDSAPIINCEEYDAATVGRMVDFLYTQDYDPFTIPQEAKFIKARFCANGLGQQGSIDEGEDDGQALIVSKDDLIAHILVHGIATEYDVLLLKILAVEKLKTALEITPWNVELCIDLVDHIYQQPAEESSKLRSSIMDFASDHVAELEYSQSYKDAVQQLETVKAFSEDLVPHVRGEMARGALRGLFARLRQTRRDCTGDEESQSGGGDRQGGEKSRTEDTEEQQDGEVRDNVERQEEVVERQWHEEQAQKGGEERQWKTLEQQLLQAIEEGRKEHQNGDEEVQDEEEEEEDEDEEEEDENEEEDDKEDQSEGQNEDQNKEDAQERNEQSKSEDVDSQESCKERQRVYEERRKGDGEHHKGSKDHQQAEQPSQDETENPGEDDGHQENGKDQDSNEASRQTSEGFQPISESSGDIPIIDLSSDDPQGFKIVESHSRGQA